MLLLPLASCKIDDTININNYTCPQLQQYSAEFQRNALAEIQATQGHNEHLKKLVDDYRRFRNACRAIKKASSEK
jgi:hypothetical protein